MMKIQLNQLQISRSIDENKQKVIACLRKTPANTLAIFPEGMLSGYFPEDTDFIKRLSPQAIDLAMTEIAEIVKQQNCACLLGSVTFQAGAVFNSTIIITPDKIDFYHKANLSILDRPLFQAGNALPVFKILGEKVAVQMCREVVFPEQWQVLKKLGANLVCHINNSQRPTDGVREHLLIARAFENQFFVASVNAVSTKGTMSSMLVSPSGQVLWQSNPQKEESFIAEIDLSEVQNYYLHERRDDLVEIK